MYREGWNRIPAHPPLSRLGLLLLVGGERSVGAGGGGEGHLFCLLLPTFIIICLSNCYTSHLRKHAHGKSSLPDSVFCPWILYWAQSNASGQLKPGASPSSRRSDQHFPSISQLAVIFKWTVWKVPLVIPAAISRRSQKVRARHVTRATSDVQAVSRAPLARSAWTSLRPLVPWATHKWAEQLTISC